MRSVRNLPKVLTQLICACTAPVTKTNTQTSVPMVGIGGRSVVQFGLSTRLRAYFRASKARAASGVPSEGQCDVVDQAGAPDPCGDQQPGLAGGGSRTQMGCGCGELGDRGRRRAQRPAPPGPPPGFTPFYPVSAGEPLSEGIGRPAPAFAEAGPAAFAFRVGRSRPVASGPRGRKHPRLEVGRYLRHRVWCRRARFGLSDCARHVPSPRGVPVPDAATVSNPPAARCPPHSARALKCYHDG